MYNSFENEVERAERAINEVIEPTKREWFVDLLTILKDGNVATVVGKNGRRLDVSRIAKTFMYASFFDVFHIRHLIDTSISPVKREENGQSSPYHDFF